MVERIGKLPDDRTCGKNVVIAKLGFRVDLKVLIADIASADKRDRVVDEQQFAVHAIVEARSGEDEFDRTDQFNMSAIHERMEYPNLDLWVGFQRRDALIAFKGVPVIDQHAHAYSAVGSAQHGVGQQLTGLVLTKNKVLQIESALGGIYHFRPSKKPVDARRDEAKRRIPAVIACRALEQSAEPRLIRIEKRTRRCLGKSGARGKQSAPPNQPEKQKEECDAEDQRRITHLSGAWDRNNIGVGSRVCALQQHEQQICAIQCAGFEQQRFGQEVHQPTRR